MDKARVEVAWWWYLVTRWLKEGLPRGIAYALPRSIVYHAVIRAWVFSQSGKHAAEHPTEVHTYETARRWDEQDH